jgi:mannose/fructose-specific phosphotransferase system component IIA
VEVKIGIQQAQRELSIETDETAEQVQQQVATAVESGGVVTLTDTKGRTVLVPAAKLAYVEIGTASVGTVGFRS